MQFEELTRYLVREGSATEVHEVTCHEVSPSGRFVHVPGSLSAHWMPVEELEIIERLPDTEQLLRARAALAERRAGAAGMTPNDPSVVDNQ